MQTFSNRVTHSKFFRTVDLYANKRVLVIGNSASGHDITTLLVQSHKPKLPVYQSRRSRSRWDRHEPNKGVEWKPVISKYDASTGDIIFADGTHLSDIDTVIYCTGYKPSYPFWNEATNDGPLYDYQADHLLDNYQHTFSRRFPRTLGFIGLPRVLTFRSFEYQAIALARYFAGRAHYSDNDNNNTANQSKQQQQQPLLASPAEQARWQADRTDLVRREKRKFHDIPWDNGETMEWFRFLFDVAGLPVLEGWGRCPPVLGKQTRWSIEHVRKYPIPGDDDKDDDEDPNEVAPRGELDHRDDDDAAGWVVLETDDEILKDSLHFI